MPRGLADQTGGSTGFGARQALCGHWLTVCSWYLRFLCCQWRVLSLALQSRSEHPVGCKDVSAMFGSYYGLFPSFLLPVCLSMVAGEHLGTCREGLQARESAPTMVGPCGGV